MSFKRELQAAVTALPGRDGRSWGGAFARRGAMKGGGFVAEMRTSAVSFKEGVEGTENDGCWVHPLEYLEPASNYGAKIGARIRYAE